jgi:hypothetical protein
MITASHGRSLVARVWRAELPVAIEHELAGPGADGIDSHNLAAGFLAFGVHMLDEHELQAFHAGFLARGHDGADNFAKIHNKFRRGGHGSPPRR